MVESVVAALRRSALAVLNNLWLLLFQVIYSLAGPVLMLGGMGIPLLFWWFSHGMPTPAELAADPLGYLLANWSVVLYAFIGWTVGATLYLCLALFYNSGLTGVIGRSAGLYGDTALPVDTSVFWECGKSGFSPGLGIASLSSLLVLPPLVLLIPLLLVALFRLPGLVMGPRSELLGFSLRFGIPVVFLGLLFALLSWFAVVWYRYALCYSVLRGETARRALRSALRFFRTHWGPVLGLAVGALVLGLISAWASGMLGIFIHKIEALSDTLEMLLVLLSIPVAWAIAVFLDIWLRSAVVVLFLDKSAKDKVSVTGDPA